MLGMSTSQQIICQRNNPPQKGGFLVYSFYMPRLVTEKTFYQYLKCPNWVYFASHEVEPDIHEPLMNQLIDAGLIKEKQRELISDKEDLHEVTSEDPEDAFNETLEAMREGKQTIYHGALIDKHYIGRPDLLERVEGKSKLGSYYYVPVDIKHSRHVRDEFQFQGCFYAELLERIQGVKPKNGYTMTPDGEVLSYSIEDFETTYKLTLDEIEKILAGQAPVHFMTSGCKQSPWFKKCTGLTESCRDLSLLNRVWREEVLRLREAGILTVEQLAEKRVADIQRLVPEVNPTRIELMRDQAIALRDNRYTIREKIDLPEHQNELFFDIESDPLRDFDYLFGVLVVSEAGEEYHAFMAESPEDEGKMWEEFKAFIEQYIDAPIYHYGTFEKDVVNRFAAKFGCSELLKEAFERNLIDLIFLIRPAILFPLSFYSLKDIASYIGFSWRDTEASGANSVLWAERYLETKDPEVKKRILEYNEDDVRATWKVQRWLREHASL